VDVAYVVKDLPMDLLLFLVWFGLVGLAGWIAEHKGRGALIFVVASAVLSVSIGAWWFGAAEKAKEEARLHWIANSGNSLYRSAPYPEDTFGSVWPWLLAATLPSIFVATALPARNRKRCPACAESVHSDALICKHCRHEFEMKPDERTAN
jgi:membrane-bound metal-dependent hydrolase YbcI (DUF457 family)